MKQATQETLSATLSATLTTPPRIRTQSRDLSLCLGEGAAYGAMVGVGETYLPAFVLAVGMSEVTAGLVASLPLLGGGLMQMISPSAVRRLGSHKKWVLLCALAQALSFGPLVFAAWSGNISAPTVFLVATLYWAAGLATGPAWNTWVGTLVPRPLRARFFARRTYLTQITVLIGLLGGGVMLHAAGDTRAKCTAFAGLFAAAASFRLVSFFLLAVQSEPNPLSPSSRRVSVRDLWERLQGTTGGQLLLYLVAVQGAVQIAGPFYAPYMLKTLRFSYAEYVALVAIAFIAKILALPHLGHLVHRVGALQLLRWSGWGIVPLAAAWIVSDQLVWLLVIQVFAGLVWAAYELAFFLLFFESFREDERTDILTLYNVANNLALVGGAGLGGLILYAFGASQSAFLLLFAISTLGRGLALLILTRVVSRDVDADPIALRTTGVRPMSGSLDSPILSSLPDQVH